MTFVHNSSKITGQASSVFSFKNILSSYDRNNHKPRRSDKTIFMQLKPCYGAQLLYHTFCYDPNEKKDMLKGNLNKNYAELKKRDNGKHLYLCGCYVMRCSAGEENVCGNNICGVNAYRSESKLLSESTLDAHYCDKLIGLYTGDSDVLICVWPG